MRAGATTTIGIAIVAILELGPRAARAEDDGGGAPLDNERYALRADVGVELDSNVHRSEVVGGVADPPIVASPLQRFVVAGTLSDDVTEGQSIALAATAAAKVFDRPSVAEENVIVSQSSLAWRIALGARSRLVGSGTYYEAFQRASPIPSEDALRRDFRSIMPALQLGWLAGETVDVTLGASYRWLVFKSDRDFDFQGPIAALDLRWARPNASGPEWELGVGVAAERRAFGGPALVGDCTSLNLPSNLTTGLPCPGPADRVDDLLAAHVEATRTSRVLVGAGYALQYNRSNSFGDTVTRHYITLRFAAPLPLAVTLAARAELLVAFYKDHVPLAATDGCAATSCTSIDNESRSSAIVDLSRPLTDRLLLFARYTLYFTQLQLNAPSGSYLRQTALLSLSYTYEK
jgi:hypothetical protein